MDDRDRGRPTGDDGCEILYKLPEIIASPASEHPLFAKQEMAADRRKYAIETATKGRTRPIKSQTRPKSIAATVTPTMQNRKRRKNLSCVITTVSARKRLG